MTETHDILLSGFASSKLDTDDGEERRGWPQYPGCSTMDVETNYRTLGLVRVRMRGHKMDCLVSGTESDLHAFIVSGNSWNTYSGHVHLERCDRQ